MYNRKVEEKSEKCVHMFISYSFHMYSCFISEGEFKVLGFFCFLFCYSLEDTEAFTIMKTN